MTYCNRVYTTLVLMASLEACTSDAEGENTGASTTSTSTTSTTTSTTSTPTTGADDTTTGGVLVCSDAFGNNNSLMDAFAFPLVADENEHYRLSLIAEVCPTESDFFRYQPPCAGYLGVEVIVDDDGDDVTLYLRNAMGTELQRSEGLPQTTVGAFRMEALHRIVDTTELFIEVEHVDGDQVPYTITTYFLPSGSCMAASWGCEATTSLVATETSCTAEPSSGACPLLSRSTTSVALPTVGTGMSAFSGWLVYGAADAVKYHTRLTTAERAALLDLCEEACEDQWHANPDVAANCDGTGVFEIPFLYSKPSYPALAAIPALVQDGSGIFGMESLACNLHDTCCAGFDESLCDIATTARVTPSSLPLSTGEEYRFDLDPNNSAVIGEAEGEDDQSALSGTVGFSLCSGGNGSGACPFHLGHLEVEAADDLEVEVTCPDESTQTLELDNLEIRLAQPAFGIDGSGTDDKGFPPGALVFEGEFDIDSTHYTVRGPNTEVVLVDADDSHFFATNVEIQGTAPCGQGLTMATGTFRVVTNVEAAPIDAPPTISINNTSPISCPTSVTFSATASDPDSDLASVRWYVDDVLMSASTPGVTFTTSHELRAVATDARGARTTATKTIACN